MSVMKDRLRELVEMLPEAEEQTALRFLEYLAERGGDPVLRALAMAPYDDEPLTDEDREAIREGREDAAAGRVMSTDDLRRTLGLDR